MEVTNEEGDTSQFPIPGYVQVAVIVPFPTISPPTGTKGLSGYVLQLWAIFRKVYNQAAACVPNGTGPDSQYGVVADILAGQRTCLTSPHGES